MRSQTPGAPWPVELTLTHLDWNPEAALVHFQGQYLSVHELDYNVLQEEIQDEPKSSAAVGIGQLCLVEDVSSGCWYRGRLQNQEDDSFAVFLLDHGTVLTVGSSNISSCSNSLFNLPPKVVCGFLANVMLLQGTCQSTVEAYFSSLVGKNVTGYIQGLLPDKVLLLEAPDINSDLVKHGFARHMDSETFLLLVEMLTEVPLKPMAEPGPEVPGGPSGLWGYKDILSVCGPRLSCGTRVNVRVTAAVSPGLFYCQMASAETYLWDMSKKLAALCESNTQQHNQKVEREHLGLLCSVRAKDGRWYRGCVGCLPVNSHVRVLLIDYGFFESVSVENLHRLPPAFHSAPIKAFPCSLSSLRGQDEAKAQQLGFLKAGLLGAVLDVEISSFDEDQHLYSITVYGAEYNSLKETEALQNHSREKAGPVLETEEVSSQGKNVHEVVMGEAFDKTLSEEEVQVGSVFVGYVEYAQSPNHFWVRTQKRSDEFEEMMTKLTDHFHQVKLDEDTLVNPERGTLCCALYERDLHFYRAVVTEILDHGIKVLFIDYGNTEKIPRMLIKRIPEVFASKSAFAFCCTLVNDFPVDDFWTSATTEVFRRAVLNKTLLVRVVHKRKTKCVVDLYDMGSDDNGSISELISAKQAEYWNHAIISVAQSNGRMCGRNAASDSTMKTELREKEGNICRNEITQGQTASFRPLRIKPGVDLAVRCSCVNSPSEFWCQPLDKRSALEQMMKSIEQYYSTHAAPHPSGEPRCVIRSPADRRWYRALITERRSQHATVLLIDYGFVAQVEENNLQTLVPEFVDLEAQAFRCSLNGPVEPIDPRNCGKWSSTAQDSLHKFVLHSAGELKCQVLWQLNVKNVGLCNVVDLYNGRTQQSMTDILVKRGLARVAAISAKQLCTAGGFPESFIYSSYGLSPGKEEAVYVSHVSSQWEVYCHLERNTAIIQELEDIISEESVKTKQGSRRAVESKLCLAKYLDGKWYRGLAQPVQSPLHLSVFFVDYGNSDICEKTQVMFLPPDSDLLCKPMQAMRCGLAAVSKEELFADAKDWLVDAVLDKQLRAVIVGKSPGGSFDVKLFDGDVNINKKVEELVLSLSPKPKEVGSFKTSCAKVKREISPVREEKGNTRLLEGRASNTTAQIKPQQRDRTKSGVSQKAQKICCVKQPRDVRDISRCSGRPQHSRKAQVPQLFRLPVRKLAAGFKAECFASHVESIHSFFLQLSEDEPTILKMVKSLNADAFKDSLKSTTSLGINDLVLAEFQEDGALYRSVVKNYNGSSCIIVEFIDYGNSAAVDKNKIYSVPADYCSLPRLSISCSLLDTGTHPLENAAFRAAVMEKPLLVEFVHQYRCQWKVKIEILEEEQPGNYQGVELCDQEAPPSAVGPQSITLKPPPVTLPVTVKGKPRFQRKPKTRNKLCSRRTRKRSQPPRKAGGGSSVTFVPMTIHAKDLENGTVLSVQSNGSFYIRPAKAHQLFAALQSCIADNLHKCEVVAEEHVKPGLGCLAQVDDKWHRAVVQHTASGKGQVLLVDHGVTVEAACDALRHQCRSIKEIPKLTVLCKATLSEGEDARALWQQTLTQMTGKDVRLVFVQYSEAEQLWMVEIVMNGLLPVGQSAATTQQNHVMLPSPTKTQDGAREQEPDPEPRPPQLLAFAPIDRSKSYFGFATAVMTPHKFCVVLEDLLPVMKKLSSMLYEHPGPMCPLPEAHLIPGSCCLFRSDSENKWCRAEIVSADACLVLNLVDHGVCERMPYEDLPKLMRLPEELVDLPKMTYPCILRGVRPVGVDGQWSDEAELFFQQRLYQKNLQIFFREFVPNTHWKVDVVADGVHVAKDLVDAGHASYLDVMLELRFQEQSLYKHLGAGVEDDDDDAGGKSGEMPLGLSGTSLCPLM